jgi:hypothetical protein
MFVLSRPSIKGYLGRFFNVENLGTECTPKCGGCKCGKCPTRGKEFTIQEELELSLIQDGLKYNDNEKHWTVSYPWIKDPHKLRNNYFAARARLQSTEKRLRRSGEKYANLYVAQIKDMIASKVAKNPTT